MIEKESVYDHIEVDVRIRLKYQRHIRDPVKHLMWSLLQKKLNSGNEKYCCFLFITSCDLLQSVPNSIDFYKSTFAHVIPVHIIVPCYHLIKTKQQEKAK